jgi:sec-independent protein translocase protein TatA
MGPVGYPEMVFIFVLALLLFGPKKLPELGRTLGKALTEFNRAKNDLKATFDREMRTLERETESIKEVTNSYYHDSYNYDYAPYDSGEPYVAPASDTTPLALEPSTLSASATEGAEVSHTVDHQVATMAPEGTIPSGSLAHLENVHPVEELKHAD